MINKNKLTSSLIAPSNATIEKFENFFRVLLPNSYKTFLADFNGAKATDLIINIESKERLVERFLCISEDVNTYSISAVIAQIEDRLTDNEDLLGVELVPFATIFGGDFLCLNFKEPGEPSVVLWDHNESEELEPVTHYIADSFEKFTNISEHK